MDIFEIIALVSTILCVILSGKQNILAWPSGIISVVALIVVYIKADMYAQIGLQSIFLVQCTIGWYNWGKKDELVISKRVQRFFIRELLVFVGMGVLFSIVLNLTNPTHNIYLTYIDGIVAFIGLLGNRYLTRKVIQAWPLFMFYNILMIILLSIEHIYLLAFLNMCLFCISFKSYLVWRKNLIEG